MPTNTCFWGKCLSLRTCHSEGLTFVALCLTSLLLVPAAMASANDSPGRDLYADTWVATDALGRMQPVHKAVGAPRANKWVGIFYWTWHTPHPGPYDVTKLLATAKEGTIEWPPNDGPYHWGEPELGYYRMTDPFVIRKHASMLADAGVDVVFFDTTNGSYTWKNEYEALCRVYTDMRAKGERTPYIAFICPFRDPTPVLNIVWNDLYKPGLWSDLWFRWEGKPFILANGWQVKDREIRQFFTFRQPMPDYWKGPDAPRQWSWLEVYPQHGFSKRRDGTTEQMSVGVAQNALPGVPGPAPMSHKTGAMGRSWHNGAKDTRTDAVHLGLNFDEQWGRALEVDPSFIFVTGWNEWTSGRYKKWHIYTDADCYYPGGMFVDQYNQEYSRDCEPMAGGHTDNYYYQLASWVRRFKGVRPAPKASGPSTVVIDGKFDDWTMVTTEFRDTVGDVVHRDHLGYGETVYTNTTGRNDFISLKTAYDKEHISFYAQTAAPITPSTDPFWMLLLLDTDQDAATGWLGYDLIINHEVLSDTETTVKRWANGTWEQAGTARYAVNANQLEIAVSRELVGETGGEPAFDFHWADNIRSFGGVEELGVNGDSAPNRRWNYRFSVAP